MSDVVIDAGVAAACLLDLPYSEQARYAIRTSGHVYAPDLLVHEVSNTLWKLVRAGALEVPRALRVILDLQGIVTHRVPGMSLAGHALTLAVELGHPAYDCFYVALAIDRHAPLVTADGRLSRRLAASALPVEVRLVSA